MISHKHLEFDKFLQHISNQCHSFSGESYLSTFSPSTDIEFIQKRQRLVHDIQKIIINHRYYDFRQLFEVNKLLSEVKTLAFNFEEFKAVIYSLKISNRLYDDRADLSEYKAYSRFIQSLLPFHAFELRFNQIFDGEGNVLDTASSELKSIRFRMRKLRDKIQSELSKTLNDSQINTYLQDKVVTKREERFVVPVKEGFAYMVEGISHGRSGSGASIYIEPKAVIPLNNELNDLFSVEKEEIYRIFCEFTKQIRDEESGILHNYEIIRKLDTYFACGRVSNELQAVVPEIVPESIIELKKARHPLLILKHKSIKKVIPFDLTLGKDFRILLISGPNTGGKTVTLKSVGLCSMMALTGFPIPADYGSKVGLFSNIFADIGDNQSIESSLSTFSGHIENIKQIVDKGDEHSLVLIDEIGSATDPEQGAALAQAILEQLIDKKVLAVITTHYTSIKIFAENVPLCVNASMQFDQEKHEPTYQFVLGFPGNSFAIEIASRLGLNDSLVRRATELTGSQSVELTDLIKKMNSEKKKLAENNYQLELKIKLQEMKAKELEAKINEMEKDKKKLLKLSLSDTQDFLTGIQKKINEEMSDIKKLGKEEKKQKISDIGAEVISFQNIISEKKQSLIEKPSVSQDIEIGNTVWITTFDAKAIVKDIKKGVYKVDMNGIFYNVKKGNLYKIQDEIVEEPVSLVSRKNIEFASKAKLEVSVRGKTYDEALPLVQDLIDNALLCGLSKVRIIHGRGTGVLRKKIRDYLKSHAKVQEFYSPPHDVGGDGVTVVVL